MFDILSYYEGKNNLLKKEERRGEGPPVPPSNRSLLSRHY